MLHHLVDTLRHLDAEFWAAATGAASAGFAVISNGIKVSSFLKSHHDEIVKMGQAAAADIGAIKEHIAAAATATIDHVTAAGTQVATAVTAGYVAAKAGIGRWLKAARGTLIP